MKYILIILLLLFTVSAQAQMNIQIRCNIAEDMLLELEKDHNESIISIGNMPGENRMLLLTNPDSPYSWSLIVLMPMNPVMSCLVASGHKWRPNYKKTY